MFDNKILTVDATTYNYDDLSEQAKVLTQKISFCDARLSEIQSELAIANTAKNAYLQALKRELEIAKG